MRGDLVGAVSVAALTIPLSLGTGLIAFAPLGPEFAPRAITYALMSMVFTGLLPIVLRNPVHYFGLSTAAAVLLAGFLGRAMKIPQIATLKANEPELYLAILLGGMALCILFSGLINVIFGLLRLGSVIKLFPQPVLAGAINGIAVLIIGREIINWFPQSAVQLLPVIIIVVVLLSALLVKRKLPVFPASVVALAAGGLLFWALGQFTTAEELGGVFGLLKQHPPLPDGITYVSTAFGHKALQLLLLEALATAFLIAIIMAITTLVSVTTVENLTLNREDGSRALLYSGFITILGSLFLALPADGSDSRIKQNYNAGARTYLSPIVFTAILILFATFLSPFAGLVPKAVISGLVMYMSVLLLDALTVQFLPRVARFKVADENKPMRNHVILSVFTAIMTLTIGFLPGLLAGMSMALFFFLVQSQTSIIYRQVSSAQVPSKTVRQGEAMQILQEKGDLIQVLELQGPLFFGSIDALTKVAENMKTRAEYLVLDMKRVSFSDSSAAMIVKRLSAKYHSLSREIVLSGIHQASQVWGVFKQFGLVTEKGDEVFTTLNEAQTWAEDQLLSEVGLEKPQDEFPLGESLLLKGLTEKEINQLEKYAEKRVFQHQDILMKEGDEADGIYIIARGRAVVQKITSEGVAISIVRFGPGVSVGEAVLLTRAPRSATVMAEGETVCYVLSMKLLAAIEKQAPNMMIKILMNVGSATARRLAAATNTIKELEQ